jgi:hypothetical protein
MSILLTPALVFLCYNALIYTPRMTTPLKLVLAVFLWIPCIGYLAFVPLVALIITICLICYYSVVATVTDDHILIAGIGRCFKMLFECIDMAWEFGTKGIRTRCREFREPQHDYDRYDFNLFWIIPSMLSPVSALLIGQFALIEYAIKIVPITISLLIAFAKSWYGISIDWIQALTFIPFCVIFVLAIPAIPATGLLGACCFFVYGFKPLFVPFVYKKSFKAIGYCFLDCLIAAELLTNHFLKFGFGEHACCRSIDKNLGSRFGLKDFVKKDIKVRIAVLPPVQVDVEIGVNQLNEDDSSEYPSISN